MKCDQTLKPNPCPGICNPEMESNINKNIKVKTTLADFKEYLRLKKENKKHLELNRSFHKKSTRDNVKIMELEDRIKGLGETNVESLSIVQKLTRLRDAYNLFIKQNSNTEYKCQVFEKRINDLELIRDTAIEKREALCKDFNARMEEITTENTKLQKKIESLKIEKKNFKEVEISDGEGNLIKILVSNIASQQKTSVEDFIEETAPTVRLENCLMNYYYSYKEKGKSIFIEDIEINDFSKERNVGINTLLEFKVLREQLK